MLDAHIQCVNVTDRIPICSKYFQNFSPFLRLCLSAANANPTTNISATQTLNLFESSAQMCNAIKASNVGNDVPVELVECNPC